MRDALVSAFLNDSELPSPSNGATNLKLNDFVRTTLLEIIEGVKAAQDAAGALGAKVNPYRGSATAVQPVEFNVELSTAISEVGEGGGAVYVGEVGLGPEGPTTERRSVGRLKFVVPLELPALQ